MNVDQRKKVVIRREGDHIHEEHIVKDTNLENRLIVSKVTQLIWFLFGVLETIIGFRILLKLIAANPNSWFTVFVYQLSNMFLWPFQNITVNPSFQGFVLEITSFIAMLVYAFVGWGIVRLIWLFFYHRATSRVTTYDRDES